MLAQLGFEVNAAAVARMYQDICGRFIIDPADAGENKEIEALGMEAVARPTVMKTLEDKERLAREVLQLFEQRATGAAGAGR
jgi:2-phospho-L-lactate transferase/gluconeogenesis factor (CofD/UPF0052 family)